MKLRIPTALAVMAQLALAGCGGRSYVVDERHAWSEREVAQQQAMPQALLASEREVARSSYGGEAPGAGIESDEEPRPSPQVASDGPRPAPKRMHRPTTVHKSVSVQSTPGRGPTSGSSGPTQPSKAERDLQAKGAPLEDAPEQALVVYVGYLKLRIRHRLDSIDAITRRTEEAGGYVQSLSGNVLVVRVPARDFESAMAGFAALGEQLDRRVKAVDVSAQFTDVASRLDIARESRERLLSLLKTVQDVEERLRIVQEIKRLSEQIETMESQLATLRDLVDYFTITIELVPVVQDRHARGHRSPFPWVRELAAHRATLSGGKDDIGLKLPDGFVLFEKDDDWRARAADTSVLRAGRLPNEPAGDATFWAAAVDHELEGRDEEAVSGGQAGPLVWRVVRNKDVRPRYWLVAVATHEDDLYVLEGFFPTEAAWKAHGERVIQSLASFEVK